MGIRERHDRERQAVRTAILDAARDLFTADGFQNVSIRKIAERIEYSPAAIYSYFASRDDIFFALAEEGYEQLDARVRAVPLTDDPLADLRGCLWAYYEFSKDRREYFALMFLDRSVPRVPGQWTGLTIVHRMLADVTARIERCVSQGCLPARLRPEAAIHLVWAAMTGPAVIGLSSRLDPSDNADALARDVLDTVLSGLAGGVALSFSPCTARGQQGTSPVPESHA